MNKLFQIFAWTSIIAGFIILLVIGYWLLFPYKIIEFKTSPYRVLTPSVKVGEQLVYEVDYCKYLELEAETTRTLTDSIVYSLQTFYTNKETGCHTTKIALDIPKTLPPSKYFLSLTYRYKVNPIRTVDIKVTTEWFEVTK